MIRVIYIAAVGHSGSTLLDLMLSAHSRIASIGEIKLLSRQRMMDPPRMERPCTCGEIMMKKCAFWQKLEYQMVQNHGCNLGDLDTQSPDDGEFRRHNQAVYQSLAKVSGQTILVDASKNHARLERLLNIGLDGIEIIPVNLQRDPRGIVHSNHHVSWLTATRRVIYSRYRLARLSKSYSQISLTYEALCHFPDQTLQNVLSAVNQEFEPEQLDWAEQRQHHLGGNEMRFSQYSRITEDLRWRTQQTTLVNCAISAIDRMSPLLGLYWSVKERIGQFYRGL